MPFWPTSRCFLFLFISCRKIDASIKISQVFPATFLVTVPGLGFLEGTEDTDDILEGTKISLPMWIAEPLIAEAYVEPDLPKPFTDPVLRGLRASAPKVNLHAQCPYYYLFAIKFIQIVSNPIASNLAQAVSEAFANRLPLIMNHTQTPLEEHSSEFVQSLDLTEREILKIGQDAHQAMKKWTMSAPRRIQTSRVLAQQQSTINGIHQM
ncbi:hypothetical protein BC828DRAFT_388731 [Blastocladiella britannica]|nr:hypothetical protein BC828DRAFT_388731 [Blastocladiella britannica]